MNAGYPTAIALIACTVLGATAGFLAARLLAGKDVGEGARQAEPTPTPAFDAFDALGAFDVAAAGTALAEEAIVAKFTADPTDAEIDALAPELPVRVRRRQRGAPPRTRAFDRL